MKQSPFHLAWTVLVPWTALADDSRSQNIVMPGVAIDYSGNAATIFHMQGVLAASCLLLALATLIVLMAIRRHRHPAADREASRLTDLWSVVALLLLAAAAIPAIRVWTVLQL